MEANLEMSFKSDMPLIKEAKIKGTAINLSSFTKMVPKGLIQAPINPTPPCIWSIKTPKTTPISMPINIFQCKAKDFIELNFSKAV